MAFQFGKNAKPASQANGKEFLTTARDTFSEVFASMFETADEADDFGQWLGELEQAAWDCAEKLIKSSYKNGLSSRSRRR